MILEGKPPGAIHFSPIKNLFSLCQAKDSPLWGIKTLFTFFNNTTSLIIYKQYAKLFSTRWTWRTTRMEEREEKKWNVSNVCVHVPVTTVVYQESHTIHQ